MDKEKVFGRVFSRGVVEAKVDSTAEEIACLMGERNIGVVVIMRNEKLIGIVSERDIVRRVVSKGLSCKKTKAKDFMTKKIITANFKDGLESIYQTLCKSKFRHLPIMAYGKLVGILSQRDIIESSAPANNSQGIKNNPL